MKVIANSNAPHCNRETEKQLAVEINRDVPPMATHGNNLLERVAMLLLAQCVNMPQGEPPRLVCPR